MNIEKLIRDVRDFPKPGIVFKDITPLLADPAGLRTTIDRLAEPFRGRCDLVLGIESRGFILGAATAYALGTGFALVRKPGKLPWRTHKVTYDLEYGTDTLEIHHDAVLSHHRVLLVDDLLATGGTAAAAVQLVRRCGGTVVACAFVVELAFLAGRKKLPDLEVRTLLRYDGE